MASLLKHICLDFKTLVAILRYNKYTIKYEVSAFIKILDSSAAEEPVHCFNEWS